MCSMKCTEFYGIGGHLTWETKTKIGMLLHKKIYSKQQCSQTCTGVPRIWLSVIKKTLKLFWFKFFS